MGVVYRARDNAIGRQVALKVMRPEVMNSADLRERFLREARAAGNLQHPNIVVVYDLGEDNGSPYIAMEFLGGQGLDKALDAGSLNTTEKLQLFAQICDGLQFAHEAGVVHRDIKPANVVIVRSGAKLLDFGIARMAGSQITRNTAIIGTVSYMSPEQIRGKGVDARSDIFSAGVMLYEMLSGRRPFDQDSDFDTMQAIVAQEPPELEVEGVISPDALATIVRRALEKDPAQRYQTAQEFGAAVRSYLRAQESSGVAETVVRSRPAPAATAPAPAREIPATVRPEPAPSQAPVQSAPEPTVPPRTKTAPAVIIGLLLLLVFGGVFALVRTQQNQAASEHLPNYGTRSQVPVQLRLVEPPQSSGAVFHLKGTEQTYILGPGAIVDESDIASAAAGFDANQQPVLTITFNANGAAKLRKASGENVGRQLAVVINAEIVSVATIQTELGESVQITGLTQAEAENLAKRINGESR